MKQQPLNSMKWNRFILLVVIGSWFITGGQVRAQSKERDQIPDKYKWNLADIYTSSDGWQKDKAILKEKIDKVASYSGTLKKSSRDLYEALEYINGTRRLFDKLWVYASLLSDQDLRQSGPMAMKEELRQMNTTLNSNLSYLEPEILAIPAEQAEQFFQEEPKLEIYRQYFKRIQRRKPHTGSDIEEKLIADAGLMAGVAKNVFAIFNNAEMPYEVIKFSDGTEVAVDVPMYERYRSSSNREDRIKAFNAFFGTLGKYRGTYAALLNGKINENLFYKKVQKFDSILESGVFPRDVPAVVFTNLIKNIHAYLPLLHRYMRIRQHLLGLEELHYYDFYPDLVKGVELKYNYQEGQEILKKALRVLGDEYAQKLDEAFKNRWIDVYPSPGKDSGAYCDGSYDTHPFVKLNYNDRFPDLNMMAHELGHAMHNYFTNKTQPYIDSNYSSFVAEVAANTNEALATEYVINSIKDPKIKLALLGSWLEQFRTTLFRQTLFSEFEMIINQKAEQGETLSGDKYNQIYLELLKKYYGHDEGAAVIDEVCGNEWAYISHFYLRFYNFQYSTSFTAGMALAEKMSTGGKEMVKKYIEFLSTGSADFSLPMLQKLGLDMAGDEVFKLSMDKMKKILDEMEQLMKTL